MKLSKVLLSLALIAATGCGTSNGTKDKKTTASSKSPSAEEVNAPKAFLARFELDDKGEPIADTVQAVSLQDEAKIVADADAAKVFESGKRQNIVSPLSQDDDESISSSQQFNWSCRIGGVLPAIGRFLFGARPCYYAAGYAYPYGVPSYYNYGGYRYSYYSYQSQGGYGYAANPYGPGYGFPYGAGVGGAGYPIY